MVVYFLSAFDIKVKLSSKQRPIVASLYVSIRIHIEALQNERTGHWELHLLSVSAMVPHFFAMDRPNYARWLPVYIMDMRQLATNGILKFIKNLRMVIMQLVALVSPLPRCGQTWHWNRP